MSGETGRAGSDSPERAKSAELRRLMAQTGQSKKAELARQESFVERHPNSCLNMTLGFFWRRKCTLMLLVAACCALVVYCVPFIDVQPEVPDALPQVPFNFKQGPLSASQPQLIKVQHFFVGLMRGPESLAIDSTGSIYMAVEGGFVLQARLNATPTLTKIAELNPIRTASQERRMQSQHATARRECQLDEKLYGAQNPAYSGERGHPFSSHISISRCSKPLGLRLSNDEAYLYIVDTLEGLYRVSLRVADKANPSQRLVTKLINFQINRSLLLPIHQADQLVSSSRPAEISPLEQVVDSRPRRFINVTLRAVDDLLIDPGAGTRGADLIYLSDASQRWQATSFFFDLLEGRPSGVILRYDTGSNQLSVLNPSQVAHVRTSTLDLINSSSRLYTPVNSTSELIFPGIGAPRLNEDDVFDDRPLFFPNGLEMTEDRQALLITDTSNKRIIKHYIRGPRVGTSDHWAWTPNFPDNIRRGAMKNEETYWVVGCGEDNTDKFDVLAWLRDWPSLRKYILKNIYFVGATLETLGANLGSSSIRDAGFALKTGDSLSERACQGMMILQYNKYGDIIRSVYSPHFPNDLVYYSQVNEVIDAENNEHVLYLGSPAYSYITKLVLPALASEPASNEVPS